MPPVKHHRQSPSSTTFAIQGSKYPAHSSLRITNPNDILADHKLTLQQGNRAATGALQRKARSLKEPWVKMQTGHTLLNPGIAREPNDTAMTDTGVSDQNDRY